MLCHVATQQNHYRKFRRRLITFDYYEGNVMPRFQLAKAGFIRPTFGQLEMPKQINKQQQVHDAEEELDEDCKEAILCVWCGLILHKFRTRVDVMKLHQLHSPMGCAYLQEILKNDRQPGPHLSSYDFGATDPLVVEDDCWSKKADDSGASKSAKLENLGVVKELCKHPELAIETRRKATFLTYPYGVAKGAAELVEAGYFYDGNGDSVTCFSCGIESANWKVEETPWQRHARSSKNCQFVIVTKGLDFVNQVIEQFQEYFIPEPENKINNVTTRMLRPRMDSPSIQGPLSTVNGRDRSPIRTVVSNRIMKGKPDFARIADIIREVTELRASNPPYSQKLILPRHSKPTTVESEEQSSRAAIQREAVVETAAASLGAASSAKDDKSMDVEDIEPERRDVPHSMDSLSTSLTTDSSRSEPQTRIDPLAALKNVESYRVITSQLTCKICLSAVVGFIFLPCGHLVCNMCADAMQQCPFCRQSDRKKNMGA